MNKALFYPILIFWVGQALWATFRMKPWRYDRKVFTTIYVFIVFGLSGIVFNAVIIGKENDE